jgi:hypothetical protein
MASDDKPANDREPKFSFGERELRQAERMRNLALEESAPKPKSAGGGFDPYNTSGGFDRKKNWARVGKR